MSLLRRWVALWNQREHARSLALVRILLGLVILYDLLELWSLDLVVPLFAPQDAGGWVDILSREPGFPYTLLPPDAGTAVLFHGALVLAALAFTLGFFTRSSTLILLLLWSAHAYSVPPASRAVDQLCRDFLGVLVLSGAGRTLSIDALIRTGSVRGDGSTIGAWARYLIITQLVVMYCTAGLQKVGMLWMPMGHFGALYVILQDPAIARFDFAWLAHQPAYLLTQLGTLVTVAWQIGYPLVLLWLYYKNTPDRPGRLRAFANRYRLHWVWIGVGALFHLLLAATVEIGIFPWAMLAAYAAFLLPPDPAAERPDFGPAERRCWLGCERVGNQEGEGAPKKGPQSA